MLKGEGEKIVLANFSNLNEIFPSLGNHARLISISGSFGNLYPYVDRILQLLARCRIVGSVGQINPLSAEIERKRGFLPLTIFWGGYCQDEKIISTRLLSRLYYSDVVSRIAKSTAMRSSKPPIRCFVHVRRTDYLKHPSPAESAALPAGWYLRQMERMRTDHKGVSFAVVSDDMPWARKHLGGSGDTQFLDLGARDAFVLMSTSQCGILSPSTFSWWASYFAHKTSNGVFIAPQFWTGWRTGKWHPHDGIVTSFLTYDSVVPVDE